MSSSQQTFPGPVTGDSTLRAPRSHARIRRTGGKRRWFFGFLFLILDILLWCICYFGLTRVTGSYNIVSTTAVFLPASVLILCIALVGGYRYRTDFASLRYASEHLISCLFAYLMAAFLLYVVASFGPSPTSSRAIFSAAVVLFGFGSLLGRRMFWFASSTQREARKFLAIVDPVLGPVFYRDYRKSGQHQGLRFVAANRDMIGQPFPIDGERAPIVEASHLLPHLDGESGRGYEAVIIASETSSLPSDVLERLGIIHFEEMPVYSMESFYEKFWARVPLEIIGPAWPLESDFLLMQHSVYSSIKRLLDFLTASLILILLSPVLLLVGLLVLLFDGRPVIYAQPRTGLHCETFTLFKFRTMRRGSDQGDRYTREGDSRVTLLGSILRKLRIDELPQLWNVIRGDMSMIGPRAEWVKLVADYEIAIPHYHFRHLVRPGISGWAQVNYPYGASMEDTLAKLSYDLYYIRNFSLRLDAEVLLKTLHVVLFGKGR
jgi:exopolysaccharide biosynthesis polyprenyl glycosylphosphotransferase